MKTLLIAATALCLMRADAVMAQASTPPAAPAAAAVPIRLLTVDGAVQTPLSLSMQDLAKMPRATVKINEDGTDIVYEGVLLTEILKKAGAASGGKLRGKALASYLLCEAKDGYRALFALAEFDPDFNENPIIVADTRDGKPLFDYQGPFRIVAPRDKRAARSVRMVTRLTVVAAP